jgi:hypothetical protein
VVAAVVPVGPGVVGGAGVATDGVANGVDALTVVPDAGGATTVIFVVLPVCTESRASLVFVSERTNKRHHHHNF